MMSLFRSIHVLKSNKLTQGFREEKNIEKLLINVCNIICYLGVFYVSFNLISAYINNKDSSQISTREFNKYPEGRYPSFTICFKGKEQMINDKLLQAKYGVSADMYYSVMSGDKSDGDQIIPHINFKDAVVDIETTIAEFTAEDEHDDKIVEWEAGVNNKEILPLRRSYEDPASVCYTYDTLLDSSVSLSEIGFKVNSTVVIEKIGEDGAIYSQAHYPGHMIRSARTYILKIKDLKYVSPDYANNNILVMISGITIMRLRKDAVTSCDPELVDEDAVWMKHVVTTIGCWPSFWNNSLASSKINSNDMPICTSQNQLKELKKYWLLEGKVLTRDFFKKNIGPCQRMNMYATIDKRRKDDVGLIKIKFRIQDAFYQDILNEREIRRSGLWANLGGNVGIFLGYSLLGATMSIGSLLNWIKKLLNKFV